MIVREAQVQTSRLYALDPQGAGTPLVESLTSYVARLAWAHCVTQRSLVTLQVAPTLNRSYLLTNGKVGGTLWRRAVAINGVGEWAEDWIESLQLLTTRQDLRPLTMLPWAAVLPPRGLLRRTRAWCPYCLQGWRDTGVPVYEPLIWALEVVTTCGLHGTALSTSCCWPECGATSTHLSARSVPGYCPACGCWQGASTVKTSNLGAEAAPASPHEGEWHTWVWQQVGTMLAGGESLASLASREHIAATLRLWLRTVAEDSPAELGRLCGLSPRSAGDIATGAQLPQLSTLLSMCYRQGILPTDLLTGTLLSGGAQTYQVVALAAEGRQPIRRRRRKGKSPRVFERDRLEAALRAVLVAADDAPPTMRAVARELGYDPSHLYKHLPGLCRAIAGTHKAWVRGRKAERLSTLQAEVRAAALECHAAGVYPSSKRVARSLSRPRQIREPGATAAWREAVYTLGWGAQNTGPRREGAAEARGRDNPTNRDP